MRLLLDTHIYLWSVMDDRKLTKAARTLILEADEVFVSGASIWEASIKVGLGKLEADVDLLVSEISASGFLELPVRAVHAALVRNLPDIHRDPFDRLLVAQAMSEPLRLVTSDGHLSKYTELVIAV
ncbi:type II toxin-antitoxin system VapC family toxin [Burkholderia glumae]|uniref:Type II toxin-antitoxin system VapC family toxin n=1 Tax=Burkholderia glumae TaxID=337 RepID=A0ABY5BE15_BURGL|nr:type II toxin-antitoxin system VapC family toxin [Burkholderia glumae]MCM2552710.1 type II toxin-antitoxin system VapC family toxin [Burkholderia glumae]MCQ0034140.1 type II toxin-antitoxin system VapC family toxin [Burkholderia glumae]MCQ0037409.1 type II toxin-antitoxin system VapC family toxin [Burkholderia glumae]QGA41763.1 PIN domain-containing protein [Burkholderia glumae]USS44112.1 type II toxin-antitoxin system VapC family toxin [Burkholderia glumae]